MIYITEHKKHRRALRALYYRAFPKNEQKPFFLIAYKAKKKQMQILCIENEQGEFLGLAIVILHRDIVLLDYFAIHEDKRQMGIGKAALHAIFDRYKEKRVLLEIERTDIPSENQAERLRRKKFYLSCGMGQMDYLVDLFGVDMEILTRNCHVTYPEYHAIFETVFSPSFAKNVKWKGTIQNDGCFYAQKDL